MTIDNESLKEITKLSTMMQVITDDVKDIKQSMVRWNDSLYALNEMVIKHDIFIKDFKANNKDKIEEKNMNYKKVIAYASVLSSSISIVSIAIAVLLHIL